MVRKTSVAKGGGTKKTDEEEIKLRSYLIWEREGKPLGKAEEHWQRAEAELAAERGTPARRRPGTTAKSRAPKRTAAKHKRSA